MDRLAEFERAQWQWFRECVGRLSAREKLRPAHWRRVLCPLFRAAQEQVGLPADEVIVERVITRMMDDSRTWCNPEIGVDEVAARAALEFALGYMSAYDGKDSTGTDGPSVDSGPLSPPVDVAARTAALARELGL
jgi:hypothetical protein